MFTPARDKNTDDKLTHQIYRAIGTIESLSTKYMPIYVESSNGVVTLEGIVANDEVKQEIKKIVYMLPGVKQIKDNLLSGHDLEFEILQALTADPRIGPNISQMSVNIVNGTVFLAGLVLTTEHMWIAERIAAHIPGVKEVCNHLLVQPELELELGNNNITPPNTPPSIVSRGDLE